jgi:DNA-binding response OmpR family regulator
MSHPTDTKIRIAVVDDDLRLRELLSRYLGEQGFAVQTVADGAALDRLLERERVDLVVLDLMLPGVGGLEVCRTLRARGDVPIIMLTARSTEDDTLEGLAAGADDFVTKPFSPRELVARVGAVLRRARPQRDVLCAGPVEIDLGARIVRCQGRATALTPAEFRILEALAAGRGRPLTRAQLAERAFGHEYEALGRTIDAHVMNLRRKIEPDRATPTIVLTVFGVGYRLVTTDGD